ncbi:hypothetical protein HPB50_000087 [Hyalomma asiaticum]|uniref:Uncharacterized protein n=1 Tax=Hyalomma asiaticum TaxID=266040 RepID=A0ACB7S2X9_HYAAI|nr:hypothetical protein HPB50_000087 [Hyalomma asiaticum]
MDVNETDNIFRHRRHVAVVAINKTAASARPDRSQARCRNLRALTLCRRHQSPVCSRRRRDRETPSSEERKKQQTREGSTSRRRCRSRSRAGESSGPLLPTGAGSREASNRGLASQCVRDALDALLWTTSPRDNSRTDDGQRVAEKRASLVTRPSLACVTRDVNAGATTRAAAVAS